MVLEDGVWGKVFWGKKWLGLSISFYEFPSWNTEHVCYLPGWKGRRGDSHKSSQKCFVGSLVLLQTFYSSRSDSNLAAWDGPPKVGMETFICSSYMQWDFFSSNKDLFPPLHAHLLCSHVPLTKLCSAVFVQSILLQHQKFPFLPSKLLTKITYYCFIRNLNRNI